MKIFNVKVGNDIITTSVKIIKKFKDLEPIINNDGSFNKIGKMPDYAAYIDNHIDCWLFLDRDVTKFKNELNDVRERTYTFTGYGTIDPQNEKFYSYIKKAQKKIEESGIKKYQMIKIDANIYNLLDEDRIYISPKGEGNCYVNEIVAYRNRTYILQTNGQLHDLYVNIIQKKRAKYIKFLMYEDYNCGKNNEYITIVDKKLHITYGDDNGLFVKEFNTEYMIELLELINEDYYSNVIKYLKECKEIIIEYKEKVHFKI